MPRTLQCFHPPEHRQYIQGPYGACFMDGKALAVKLKHLEIGCVIVMCGALNVAPDVS